jgi:hypothetical protein
MYVFGALKEKKRIHMRLFCAVDDSARHIVVERAEMGMAELI